MSHYAAVAYDRAGTRSAYDVPGASPAPGRSEPVGARLVQSDWTDAPPVLDAKFCQSTKAESSEQCRAYPKKGTPHCAFHTPSED